MRIDVPCKKVIVRKGHWKFLLCKMSPCKSVYSFKSDPACKRVAVQKCLLVQKWPCVQKSRRAKESPCKRVTIQKCPLVQEWPWVQVSLRAKVTLRAKVSPCKSNARAKVTRSLKTSYVHCLFNSPQYFLNRDS